ncbi:MAG: hypothetical protein WC529_01995 [Candidatus Margulisiibacteriota bacterium]
MKKLATVLAALLFGTLACQASFISLNTTLTSKLERGKLRVMVQVVNKGDESAFGVQAELRVGGRTILAEKKQELPVNAAYQVKALVPLDLQTPGSYPLILVMHYTDANQYPFSALTGQAFVYQREGVPPLFGQVKPATFAKEGRIDLLLKNSGDREIKATTRLVIPRELTVAGDAQPLTVPARGQKSASFSLSNFSALSGSTYQVFAVAEFEDNGLHYTCLAPGTVKINESNVLVNYQAYFIALIVILALGFVALQFVRE